MLAQGRDGRGKTAYERHQPEQTLLYQLIETHYPALVDQLAQQGKSLPDHVHREFEAYLKCGRLEHGFIRAATNGNYALGTARFKQKIEAAVGRRVERGKAGRPRVEV